MTSRLSFATRLVVTDYSYIIIYHTMRHGTGALYKCTIHRVYRSSRKPCDRAGKSKRQEKPTTRMSLQLLCYSCQTRLVYSAYMTMNRYAIFLLVVCVALLDGAVAFCNVASPKSSTRTEVVLKVGAASAPLLFNKPSTRSSLVLHQNMNGADTAGMRRGVPIFIFTLMACVWLFTIPPEFRRTRFCGAVKTCIDNPASCHNCKTVGELSAEIKDYYKNGGGIQWDFSIDPETKAQFYNTK